MTDTVTILAQKRNRPHSHRLYMERITINREDELFIWVLKANLACIVYYQSQADTAAEADGPQGNIQGATRKFLGHFKNIIRIIQRKICNRKLSLITYIYVFPYAYAPFWLGGMWVYIFFYRAPHLS